MKGSEGKEGGEGGEGEREDGGQEEEQLAEPSKESWAEGGEEKGACPCHSF